LDGTGSPNRSKISSMMKKICAWGPKRLERPWGLGDLTPSPSVACQSACALALGLDGVMRSAQAHAVARIGRVAAVSAFPDVVSEEAMLRRWLCAALAILDPLATEASTLEDSNAKLSVSCRMVERIGTFRLRPNGTAVTFRHEGVKHRDARHDHCQSETVGGGLGLAFRDCRSERVARRDQSRRLRWPDR